MKKIFLFLAVVGLTTFIAQSVVAQDSTQTEEQIEEVAPAEEPVAEMTAAELMSGGSDEPIYQQIKTKFIEGGPGFMATVVLCLIIGLAVAIERIIYLNLATTDTQKLVEKIDAALKDGGVEKAKDVCRETRGPVASIFYDGLMVTDKGLAEVEKKITSRGSVEMGKLESGLSWVALFIALAPMLGFLGTVIGMVGAFDAIEAAGDISPTVVAGGIKVALITTIGGLIVAVILQLFYNYIVAKIDSVVNSMESASIDFVEVLADYKK